MSIYKLSVPAWELTQTKNGESVKSLKIRKHEFELLNWNQYDKKGNLVRSTSQDFLDKKFVALLIDFAKTNRIEPFLDYQFKHTSEKETFLEHLTSSTFISLLYNHNKEIEILTNWVSRTKERYREDLKDQLQESRKPLYHFNECVGKLSIITRILKRDNFNVDELNITSLVNNVSFSMELSELQNEAYKEILKLGVEGNSDILFSGVISQLEPISLDFSKIASSNPLLVQLKKISGAKYSNWYKNSSDNEKNFIYWYEGVHNCFFEFYGKILDLNASKMKDKDSIINTSKPLVKLNWTGNKNQLYDVLLQLKFDFQLISNSNTDLATFIKQNIRGFEGTSLSTIETQINKRKKPAKAKRVKLNMDSIEGENK